MSDQRRRNPCINDDQIRLLRQIHYPVVWNIGEFNHDDAKHLRKRAMTDDYHAPDLGAVHIIEAALPEHVEDSRYRCCALECHVEVETATCAKCGLWLDEDGELRGTPWPCPTARVLQLDLHVPPCTCNWAIRSRGLHDPDCAYMAATHGAQDHAPDCPGPSDDWMTGCHECSHCGGEGLTECDDPVQCTSSGCDGEVCPCDACEGTGHGCRQVVW